MTFSHKGRHFGDAWTMMFSCDFVNFGQFIPWRPLLLDLSFGCRPYVERRDVQCLTRRLQRRIPPKMPTPRQQLGLFGPICSSSSFLFLCVLCTTCSARVLSSCNSEIFMDFRRICHKLPHIPQAATHETGEALKKDLRLLSSIPQMPQATAH